MPPLVTKPLLIMFVIYSLKFLSLFPGLSYNKANNTFLNSVRKNDIEAQVEFTLKIMERARVTCY